MKNIYKKLKKSLNKKFIYLVILVCLFVFVLLLTERFSQSFHFVDEDDHLIFGHYMNQGYKLYRDLSTNHQPLVYIFGGLLQRISRPGTMFILLRRTREAVFLYGFVFSVFLLFEFGLPFLIFSFIFELTKFFIFGNLLLAESLVVYPLIFILGESFRTYFLDHKPKGFHVLIFGFCNFLIFFNLLPLIPSILILDLLYFLKLNFLKTRDVKNMAAGFVLPTALLFIIVSPLGWFKESVLNNFNYVAPELTPVKSWQDFVKVVFFPFLFIFKKKKPIFSQIIFFFTLLLLLNTALLLNLKEKIFNTKFIKNIKLKRKNKILFLWLFIILVVLLTNNRVLNTDEIYYYSGFHLLPWYSAFIFLNILMVNYLLKNMKFYFKKILLLIFLIVGVYFLFNKEMVYFQKIDKVAEHNTNFLTYVLAGKGFASVSKPGDRLAVFPNESLIYWQSGLDLATRQVAYYEWQYWVPELRAEMEEVFNNDPPEFIYRNFEGIKQTSYLPFLQEALRDYAEVSSNGDATGLYIREDRVKDITDEQWQEWRKYSFNKIEL